MADHDGAVQNYTVYFMSRLIMISREVAFPGFPIWMAILDLHLAQGLSAWHQSFSDSRHQTFSNFRHQSFSNSMHQLQLFNDVLNVYLLSRSKIIKAAFHHY